jgi:hypothetical protein
MAVSATRSTTSLDLSSAAEECVADQCVHEKVDADNGSDYDGVSGRS